MANVPEIDSEILIENVRKYEEIYDKKHKLYKNNKHKDNLWSIIAKDMNVNDPREVKKKWTYIRDKYQKEMRKLNQPSGSGSSFSSSWCLFDNVSFLKDYLRNTITKGNYSRSSTPQHYDDETNFDDLIEYDGCDSSIFNSSSTETHTSQSASKRKGDDDLTEVIALIKKKCESDLQPQPTPHDEPVDSFCSFIKSYIKKFPPHGQDEAILHITNYVLNKNKEFSK